MSFVTGQFHKLMGSHKQLHTLVQYCEGLPNKCHDYQHKVIASLSQHFHCFNSARNVMPKAIDVELLIVH